MGRRVRTTDKGRNMIYATIISFIAGFIIGGYCALRLFAWYVKRITDEQLTVLFSSIIASRVQPNAKQAVEALIDEIERKDIMG